MQDAGFDGFHVITIIKFFFGFDKKNPLLQSPLSPLLSESKSRTEVLPSSMQSEIYFLKLSIKHKNFQNYISPKRVLVKLFGVPKIELFQFREVVSVHGICSEVWNLI